MHLDKPTKLTFTDNEGYNHNIAKVQASGSNSAAFNSEKSFWLWGGTQRGKLGLATTMRDQMEPLHV